MDRTALEDVSKRMMTFLPLAAAVSGVIGGAIYYILRRSQVITLQHYGLDSALVSTSFQELIVDGLSTVVITFLFIIGFNRLAAIPVRAGKSLLLKIPAIRLYRDSFHQKLESRSLKAGALVATLLSLALALAMVFTPLSIARWHISRVRWLVDANLCQNYCFTYQLSSKDPPINGLPLAVGSSRLIVIAANDRAHLLEAQSLRSTIPSTGAGQKALSHAPLHMKISWLLLDAVNGNFRGLWNHALS